MTAQKSLLVEKTLFENIGACNLTLSERIHLQQYRFELSFMVKAILIRPTGVRL